MTDQSLRQLLLDADAAASPVVMSRDLAGSVRNRLRRRRTNQFMSASIILCAMLALAPLLHSKPSSIVKNDVPKIQDELNLIRLRAQSQAATVNRLISYQNTLTLRNTAAKKAEVGRPLDRIQHQRETAARLLTHDGDYRRVLELFPDTSYASIARQRLQT